MTKKRLERLTPAAPISTVSGNRPDVDLTASARSIPPLQYSPAPHPCIQDSRGDS